MPIEAKCGECGARYRLSDQLAGQYVQCRKCQSPILVPKVAVVAQPVVDRSPPPASRPAIPAKESPVPAAPAPNATRPAAPPAEPVVADDDDDFVVKFRDDDDETPAARPAAISNDDESVNLEPDLEPAPSPRRSADRGSLAGKSVTAVAMDARASRAGQNSNSDEPTVDASIDASIDADDEPDFGSLADVGEPVVVSSGSDFSFSMPVLPVVLTNTLMPWAMILGCLGWAGYTVGTHVMELPGHAVGFSLLAAAVLLYAAILVPLTLKYIHSAADTAELRLPNAVWFQTFALLGLPTAGLVIGYYAGGTSSMITLGVLGLLAMSVLMGLMYRANVMQTAMTAFYGASAYVGSSALCAGILVGIGLLLAHAGFVVPWETAPVTVATVEKSAEVVAPVQNPVEAPVVVAPKPVEAPVVEKVAPAPVIPTGPEWRVPVEAVAAAAMWVMPQREVRESIEVATPVGAAHAANGAPFVALLQPRTTAVYDLRTGKRTGFAKTAFQPRDLIISPDGTMLAGVESAQSMNASLFPADGVPDSIEIWSIAGDAKTVGRVPSDTTAVVPVPLGFAGGKLLGFGSSNGMSGLQLWDPASGLIVRQWSTPSLTRASIAVSNSGEFVAVTANPVIRLFDVRSGEIAGELSSPLALKQTKGIAFSPDGRTIAALVPGETGTALARLLQWNVADGGKLIRAVSIDLTAAVPPFNPAMASGTMTPESADLAYVQWSPDGRTVRVGDGLFETTTGKAVYTLPAAVSGNLTGRLVSVAGQRAVYEFMPTANGSRVLLKTVDLPIAMIDEAVATAALSATTQPSLPASPNSVSAVAAAVPAAPGGSAALPVGTPPPAPALPPALAPASPPALSAMTSPPAALSPTTTSSLEPNAPPHATVQLALQRQWDVQVNSIARADAVLIQNQLTAQNAVIMKIQTDLTTASLELDRVSHYREGVDGTGEIIRQYEFSDAVRTAAHAVVTRLQDQMREAKANVIKLQRSATAAPTARTVLASLYNGIPVQITTDTDTAAAYVDAMKVGDRVHIVGLGPDQRRGVNRKITLRLAGGEIMQAAK